MLNTTTTNGPITVRQNPTTGNTITPADTHATSYPNVTPDDGKITVSSTDTTAVATLDLANVQGTFKSLLVAFDDVSTIAGMLLRDNLPQYQQQVLLRLLQSHAFEYALLCENEHEVITKYLAGTRWGDEAGGKA